MSDVISGARLVGRVVRIVGLSTIISGIFIFSRCTGLNFGKHLIPVGGIDLNPKYRDMAMKRLKGITIGLGI